MPGQIEPTQGEIHAEWHWATNAIIHSLIFLIVRKNYPLGEVPSLDTPLK